MKRISIFMALMIGVFVSANAGPIKVVTTIPDLKSIAELIGGNKVSVTSIATGYQNPHFVDPKPSYIIGLSSADMFVTVGLDLETGWSPQLLSSSRNNKIQKGAAGYVDASTGVTLYQVPSAVNRAEGDIHMYGNPHYWLDPMNGKIIARNIANGLERIDPSNKAFYEANLVAFNNQIDAKLKGWQVKMAPYKGAKIIAYHNEWVYFETRFDYRSSILWNRKPVFRLRHRNW
jgi:ABC-type Zn uptake system ZnuABC Zn-binding protein ZnuA